MPINPLAAAFFIHFRAAASDGCGPLTMSSAVRLDATKMRPVDEPVRYKRNIPTIDPSFCASANFRSPSPERTTGITEGVPGIMYAVLVIVLTFEVVIAIGCRSHVISIRLVSAGLILGV